MKPDATPPDTAAPDSAAADTAPPDTAAPAGVPRSRSDAGLRRRHREALIASLLILIAAPLLQVLPDQRVALAAASLKLPPLCPSNAIFGIRCPGCGLTRSFVHLAHADLLASLHDHRLGWLVALIVLLQIPYRAWALLGPTPLPLGRRLPAAIAHTLLAALIANWLAEQLH